MGQTALMVFVYDAAMKSVIATSLALSLQYFPLIIANSMGFLATLHFLKAKCEVAHTIFPFSPSKVRHGDIYLAPGGDTWHQNQNQLGSHMSSGWFLR
jgi:hypothetical protein